MLRLILDRSGGCAGFAVAQEKDVLCELRWEGGSIRSPNWFADLSAALAKCGCRVEDVDEFICAVGPGSFSGIRSALAALEGMALPGKKPVLGISSAAALAYERRDAGFKCVTVIGDARRSTLWITSFKFNSESGLTLLNGNAPSQSTDDFKLITRDDIEAEVPDGSLVISPDWDRIGDVLSDKFSAERLVPEKLSSCASVLAEMAERFPDLCKSEPLPVYLHPAVVVKN